MASPRRQSSSPQRKFVNALLTTCLIQGTLARAVPFPPTRNNHQYNGDDPFSNGNRTTTDARDDIDDCPPETTTYATSTTNIGDGMDSSTMQSSALSSLVASFSIPSLTADGSDTTFSPSSIMSLPPTADPPPEGLPASTSSAGSFSSSPLSTLLSSTASSSDVASPATSLTSSGLSNMPLTISIPPTAPTSAVDDAPSGAVFAPDASSATRSGNVSLSSVLIFGSSSVQVASSTISVSLESSTQTPSMSGSVITALPSSGVSSIVPFPTSVISTSAVTVSPTSLTVTSVQPSPSNAGGDLFLPMGMNPPPAPITSRSDHPIGRVGVDSKDTSPIETNKFYANLLLEGQMSTVWTFPYSLRWTAGQNNIQSWGMAISHVEASQFVYGPGNPASYYVAPVAIDSMILSASEFGSGTVLTTDSHQAFSVNVNLAPSAGAFPLLTLPLVQGMGFITGIYQSATPLIQSGVFFKELSPLTQVGEAWKCSVTLQDGYTWLVYLIPDGDGSLPNVTLTGVDTITGPENFRGIIQIAKLTGGSTGEAAYDSSAGAYAANGTVAAQLSTVYALSVTGTVMANYQLSWTKAGNSSRSLIMFALPHHVQSFVGAMQHAEIANTTLQTTTKGIARAILADMWNMTEILPWNMTFAPWSPSYTDVTSLPASAIPLINATVAAELSEDVASQTDLDSMYFSGKALAKFATIVYVANDLVQNPGLAAAGLVKLESALSTFINNSQQTPLVYDTVWRGAVSSAGYSDVNADFGNTGYNDHHFHYGYFVYAAAVIAYLDPSWLSEGTNKAWVDMLVRDYANPSTEDPYFPFSRSFDWFHGHSWAKGLFESGAGKDQESSSEDAFASYALKMWGKVSGDASLEARGNLMLAIQARSFSNYFLMTSDNSIEPANFIGNKAVGIMFEEKADHTTYFGNNIEYIEGIHMLPLNPSSGLTRSKQFINEEWSTYFSNGRVDGIAGGWRGILYANLAYIDPVASWKFFSSDSFDESFLDGGASRTWYLALAAALGGV